MNNMSIENMRCYKTRKHTGSRKYIKNLINCGVDSLKDNRFDHAKTYFKRAALCGDVTANNYFALLCCGKDKDLARDLIICAEGRM